MEPIQRKAYNIPRQDRECLLSLAEWIFSKDYVSAEHENTIYMFDLYNKYIYVSNIPEDISCANCRSVVLNRIKRIVETYEQYGTEYPSQAF